jgi:hypothetical protein
MNTPDSSVKRLVRFGVFPGPAAANIVATVSQEDALTGILHRNRPGPGPWPYRPCRLPARLDEPFRSVVARLGTEAPSPRL